MGGIEKSALRKYILSYKKLLSATEYKRRNEFIAKQTLDFIKDRNFQSVHIYLPIVRNREPDTFEILNTLNQKGIRVLISHTDFKSRKMTHYRWSPDVVLKENKLGIPEPETVKLTSCDLKVDAILMPLVAIDRKGNRLGYGGGYYDRLLAEAPFSLKKIGLSLSGPFDGFDFVEPHDIRLDYCITPTEIISFDA